MPPFAWKNISTINLTVPLDNTTVGILYRLEPIQMKDGVICRLSKHPYEDTLEAT